jgi:hypothetical protein
VVAVEMTLRVADEAGGDRAAEGQEDNRDPRRAWTTPMTAPPTQIGRSLECSPAPTAALVRIPTAMDDAERAT